jgi:hypothetical protein
MVRISRSVKGLSKETMSLSKDLLAFESGEKLHEREIFHKQFFAGSSRLAPSPHFSASICPAHLIN